MRFEDFYQKNTIYIVENSQNITCTLKHYLGQFKRNTNIYQQQVYLIIQATIQRHIFSTIRQETIKNCVTLSFFENPTKRNIRHDNTLTIHRTGESYLQYKY